MGWTPHTRAELERAGVVFGNEAFGPNDIVVLPNTQTGKINSADPQSAYRYIAGSQELQQAVQERMQPLTVNTNVTTGNNAKELGILAEAVGSIGKLGESWNSSIEGLIGQLGSAFTNSNNELGSTLNNGIQSLMNVIQQNTSQNNAWSAKQAQDQNAWQERQNQIAMEFNRAEAEKNRNWQEMMSNTAHQREVEDLKAAGLNPVLSASGGNGAATTSGATASGVTSSGAKGDTDTSANSAFTSLLTSIIAANASMENAKVSANANMYLGAQQAAMQKSAQELQAQIALASQENNMAIAQLNANNTASIAAMNNANQQYLQQQQQNYQSSHPSNAYQAAQYAGKQIAKSGVVQNTQSAIKNIYNKIIGKSTPNAHSVNKRGG